MRTRRARCRHCGEIFTYTTIQDSPFYPFCSERCKLLDLGDWLDEKHKIEEPLEAEPAVEPRRPQTEEPA